MTADADPVVTAVAEALLSGGLLASDLGDMVKVAQCAVEAHRRAVLDQRDDGERLREIRDEYERDSVPPLFAVRDLLAALADETVARRQAEAEAWARIETAGRIEQQRDALLAERNGLPEWRCPGCGAVTRARMADHPADLTDALERLGAERDALLAERDGTRRQPGATRRK